MPASNAPLRRAKLLRAVLSSTCACLLAWPASRVLAFDADLGGGVDAKAQLLGDPSELVAAPDDPFVSREIALSGVVEESFEAALVRSGAPAELSRRLREALSLAFGRNLHSTPKIRFRPLRADLAPDGARSAPRAWWWPRS